METFLNELYSIAIFICGVKGFKILVHSHFCTYVRIYITFSAHRVHTYCIEFELYVYWLSPDLLTFTFVPIVHYACPRGGEPKGGKKEKVWPVVVVSEYFQLLLFRRARGGWVGWGWGLGVEAARKMDRVLIWCDWRAMRLK